MVTASVSKSVVGASIVGAVLVPGSIPKPSDRLVFASDRLVFASDRLVFASDRLVFASDRLAFAGERTSTYVADKDTAFSTHSPEILKGICSSVYVLECACCARFHIYMDAHHYG